MAHQPRTLAPWQPKAAGFWVEKRKVGCRLPALRTMAQIQTLKGFRDFYPVECSRRNYLFATWRTMAGLYGCAEYDTPVLESTELYRRKSGDEIIGQLFCFEDKGDREVALRPETTPSLARMISARQRDFKKPMRWFQIGPCFRYESPSRGRTREFNQFNADIIGEAGSEAEAELIALAIDTMRELGFAKGEFVVRLSDRELWNRFIASAHIAEENVVSFLQTVDKWEREKEEVLSPKLDGLGTSYAAVKAHMEDEGAARELLSPLLASLEARGMSDFVEVDPSIVRGLAYYTGMVFEVFDLVHGYRAVAGGGRYDGLCKVVSEGKVDLPAVGFAMGDVVIGDLIDLNEEASKRLQEHVDSEGETVAQIVLADESKRLEAVALVQELREASVPTIFPLADTKVGKQFQNAESARALIAIVIGSEFPEITIKFLPTRDEYGSHAGDLVDDVLELLMPDEEEPLEEVELAEDPS